MAKFKRGVPEDFSFNPGPVSDLGDYLDEPPPLPRPAKPKTEPAEPKVVSGPAVPVATARAGPERRAAESPSPAKTTVAVATPPAPPLQAFEAVPERPARGEREARPKGPKGPRREISMTPDTLRMSDELLALVRSGSGQRDTAPNEMFHALVLLVYEAREELDPHTIPKRGRWGTPTARAYPLELKNAFLQAILRKYAEATESPSGLRYPVNTAA